MFSVIICSVDDARFSAVSANLTRLFKDEPHEILRIADARSVAEGYNRGIDASRGDILIFCHDDIEILDDDLPRKLRRRMEEYDLLGIAGTTLLITGHWTAAGPPHIYGQVAHRRWDKDLYEIHIWSAPTPVVENIQAMDGLFLCARRDVVENLRFDETTFDGFYLYDMDFTFSAYLRGLRLAVCTDIPVIHASTRILDDAWHLNIERFVRKFREHMPVAPPRLWSVGMAHVKTKEEILEVMTPPHFRQKRNL